MNKNIICLIPARLNSKRFPNKLLYKIEKIPLFLYVYKKVKAFSCIDEVYIATGDDLIESICHENQVNVIKTFQKHYSGTSRIIEALETLKNPADFILNIQADEPLIDEYSIKKLIHNFHQLKNLNACGSLKREILENESKKIKDPNCVKVFTTEKSRALAFKRNLDFLDENKKKYFEHIGVYLYPLDILKKIKKEIIDKKKISSKENLEQLDFMKINIPIYVFTTKKKTISIDSKEDLEDLKILFKKKN